MENVPPKLYVEDPNHKIPRVRLTDEEYARAIQAMVIVCTDVAIVDPSMETIYLAKRSARPGKGWWWFIGGRSAVGETERQSITRCLHRETGLQIAEDRFCFRCMNRFFLKDREQEPQNVGCDSLSYTFSLDLTSEERRQIVLDKAEYGQSELGEFDRKRIQQSDIQPAISDFYKMVFG